MKLNETMMWAGPLPPGEVELDITETAVETMTLASPLVSAWEPALYQPVGETVMWAGPLPPAKSKKVLAVDPPERRLAARV